MTLIVFFVVDSSSSYNVLLGRDWMHSNWCIPSSLYQFLNLWNCDKVEVVRADNRSFASCVNNTVARFYDDDVGPTRIFHGQGHQKANYGSVTGTEKNFRRLALRSTKVQIIHHIEPTASKKSMVDIAIVNKP